MYFLPFEVRLQRRQRISEHATKDIRSGMYAVVLQEVNQFAQSAVIAAVSDCSLEGTIEAAAHRAPSQSITVAGRVRRKNLLAADGADTSSHRLDFTETVGTNGQARNI